MNEQLRPRFPHDQVSADASCRAELLDLIRGVGAYIKAHMHRVLAAHRLTPPLFALLRELDGPASMRDVAGSMHCDASYVTGLADRLESLGLVERQPDPSDRRIRHLVLTPAGADVRGRVLAEMGRAHLFPELDDGDVVDLVRVLRKLIETPAGVPRSSRADRRGSAVSNPLNR